MITDVIKAQDLPTFKELYTSHFTGAWSLEQASEIALLLVKEMWVDGIAEFFNCFTTEVIYTSARPSSEAKTRLIQNLIAVAPSLSQLKVLINQIADSNFALPLILTLTDPFSDIKEVSQSLMFSAIKRGVN